MSKTWLIAVVIALIATAILEKTCGRGPDEFNPIIDHSEIKAHIVEVDTFKTYWSYKNGDSFGHIYPSTDTILIENYDN